MSQEQIDQLYCANAIAEQAAAEELANQGSHDMAVAQALIANTLLVEQARQENQLQWAVTQASAVEERMPEWVDVEDGERNRILERAGRNNAAKPFSLVGSSTRARGNYDVLRNG